MTLPDRYPPLDPIQHSIYVPPPYTDRSPRYRGPAITDVEAVVRNVERIDEQWQRCIPNDNRYENEYFASSTDASMPEILEPSPPLRSNAPFYVPRSPPAVIPHPSYQRGDFRPEYDMDPGLNQNQGFEYRPGLIQYQSYQQPILASLPEPQYLQTPMPVYDPPTRWSNRQPSPERSRPPPFMPRRQPSRERLAPLRERSRPPPPMQRSYSQGRHSRAQSGSRRNPYPSADRGRGPSSSRYSAGKRRGFNNGSRHYGNGRNSGL